MILITSKHFIRATFTGMIVSLLLASSANAQVNPFAADTFEPRVSNEINILNVSSSGLLPHLSPSFGLTPTYLDSPVELPGLDGEGFVLVDSAIRLDVTAGLGLFDFMEIGFAIPMNVHQSSPNLSAVGLGAIEGFAAGDLRTSLKLRLLRPEGAGFGIAIAGNFYAPTGDQDSFMSDGEWRYEPRLAVDYKTTAGFQLAANFGMHIRPERQFLSYISDDSIRWGLGAVIPAAFIDNVEIVATVSGDHYTADQRDPTNLTVKLDDGLDATIAVNGTIKYSIGRFHIQAGAGSIVSSEMGASNPYFMLSTGYAEDAQDSDGDGLLDSADQCPNKPEDMDGFEDDDGCPDGDNDKDGVTDLQDDCPSEKEDKDGFEDDDGCPDRDNDNDRIADAKDKCPLKAEDKDGFEDSDGCPDLDNDADGIADTQDKCPNKKETANQYKDDDGCPDWRLNLSAVTFAPGRAKILETSSASLKDAVKQIKALPSTVNLRVEGHTDNIGVAKRNLKLSEQRAKAVMDYLVKAGISAQRLTAKGFGSQKPVASNKDKAGRAQNRRVEIVEVKAGKK